MKKKEANNKADGRRMLKLAKMQTKNSKQLTHVKDKQTDLVIDRLRYEIAHNTELTAIRRLVDETVEAAKEDKEKMVRI